MTGRSVAAIAVLALFATGAVLAAIAGTALIVYVPYAAVGAILVLRRPDNSIGWLLTGSPGPSRSAGSPWTRRPASSPP